MQRLDTILQWTCFVLLCATVLVAPWLFGAWEMWWFWPFMFLLFLTLLFFSVRLILCRKACSAALIGDVRLFRFLIISFVPFLTYALVRYLQAEVYVDAERNFLLFVTPVFLMLIIIASFSDMQIRLLYAFILADLFSLGIYGVVNYSASGSAKILWTRQVYEQYFGRATGTYFCPDHYAGLLEIMIALSLGLMLGRGRISISRAHDGVPDMVGPTKRRRRRRERFSLSRVVFAATIIIAGLVGVLMSKSRGGGVTVGVLVFASLLFGFRRMKPLVRWSVRLACIGLMLLTVFVLFSTDMSYVVRFKKYFGWNSMQGKSIAEKRVLVTQNLQYTSRYNMYSAALRAWKTEPVWGIGPGMHQNLWPHFAPSPDGDRESGKWPSRPNYKFHSYEVHSDWIQLLEEYGVVGLLLFSIAFISVAAVLIYGVYWRAAIPAAFGGLLALIAMAFHSLGDFNLQIPATTWLLACVIAVALANVLRAEVPRKS